MAGVYKLDITESAIDLKHLLTAQKSATDKERIQLLYLLKTEQAQTVQAVAALLGRHRVTVQKWLSHYRRGDSKPCWNTNPALDDNRASRRGRKPP